MDSESIRTELRSISNSVQCDRTSLTNEFEKLLIATTNVLRLTDGQQGMLATLQGNPQDLHRYLLNLIRRLQEMVISSSDRTIRALETLQGSV